MSVAELRWDGRKKKFSERRKSNFLVKIDDMLIFLYILFEKKILIDKFNKSNKNFISEALNYWTFKFFIF